MDTPNIVLGHAPGNNFFRMDDGVSMTFSFAFALWNVERPCQLRLLVGADTPQPSYFRDGNRPNNSKNPILVRQKNVPAIQSNALIDMLFYDYMLLLHLCQ